MTDIATAWQKQKEFLDAEKKKDPLLFERKTITDDREILKQIGINTLDDDRPPVYLRLWPQDFVVEEISKDGRPHSIDYAEDKNPEQSDGRTVYADLVKAGISTFDAVEEFGKLAGIDRMAIGYAGIKDRDAITSQLVSFRNLPINSIRAIEGPNFFLKNIYQGKGAVQIGDLIGNKFTLVLRGVSDFDERQTKEKLEELAETGFWNFFYTQRFGTPRLISHYLGLLLLKRNYEEVFKALLNFKSKNEVGYYSNLRDRIAASWGDWPTVYSILEPLTYSFRRELAMIGYLKNKPGDFLGALRLFPDQVQIWIFAYASYLFNRKLSKLMKNGTVPEQLPLVLSKNQADWEFYGDLLRADELAMPSPVFRDFPSIQMKDRLVNTSQSFKFHDFKNVPGMSQIAVVSFTLPKGSYATTLLAHLFTLSGNIPVLAGIRGEIVDSKEILGTGRVAPVAEVFKGVINSKLEISEEAQEESVS